MGGRSLSMVDYGHYLGLPGKGLFKRRFTN